MTTQDPINFNTHQFYKLEGLRVAMNQDAELTYMKPERNFGTLHNYKKMSFRVLSNIYQQRITRRNSIHGRTKSYLIVF